MTNIRFNAIVPPRRLATLTFAEPQGRVERRRLLVDERHPDLALNPSRQGGDSPIKVDEPPQDNVYGVTGCNQMVTASVYNMLRH